MAFSIAILCYWIRIAINNKNKFFFSLWPSQDRLDLSLVVAHWNIERQHGIDWKVWQCDDDSAGRGWKHIITAQYRRLCKWQKQQCIREATIRSTWTQCRRRWRRWSCDNRSSHIVRWNVDAFIAREYWCRCIWHGRWIQKWWLIARTRSHTYHRLRFRPLSTCAGKRIGDFLVLQWNPLIDCPLLFGQQINCARRMRDIQNKSSTEKSQINDDPDFAETVELCFVNGPPQLRRWSSFVRFLVNLFICVTQMGFCCIYFVFIATNFKQVTHWSGGEFPAFISICFHFVSLSRLIRSGISTRAMNSIFMFACCWFCCQFCWFRWSPIWSIWCHFRPSPIYRWQLALCWRFTMHYKDCRRWVNDDMLVNWIRCHCSLARPFSPMKESHW